MPDLMFDEASHVYTLGGEELPSVTQICEPLTAGKYPAGAGVVEAAAARGTRVHELCALYDVDAMPDEFEAELAPYLQAWAAFCRDYRPTWEFIEHRMWGMVNGNGIAGTADRICVIDRARMVVDIKTAQSMDRASKVALCCQLEGYAQMATERGIDVFATGLGVQLMKDGTYRIHDQRKIEEKYGFDSYQLLDSLRKIHKITKGK